MEKDTKVFIGVILIILVCVAYNSILSKEPVYITGRVVDDANLLNNPDFEIWTDDFTLTNWVIDRQIQYLSTIPKESVRESIVTYSGLHSVVIDTTDTTNIPISWNPPDQKGWLPLVKQSNIPITKNTNYEFSIYAKEEVANIAAVILIFGDWTNKKYGSCTRGTLDSNGWIKITCKGNSGDYDKSIIYFSQKTGTRNKIWYDNAQFIKIPTCGNNIKEGTEQCDDGNILNNDGCSSICTTEAPSQTCNNNVIEGTEQCDNSVRCTNCVCNTGYRPTTPITINCELIPLTQQCGNNIKEGTEQCDDGNILNNDGCSSTCTTEAPILQCGNGNLDAGEQCEGGVGCTNCVCISGYVPNDPISMDCKAEVPQTEEIIDGTCTGCLSTVDGGNKVCFKLGARYIGKYCGINAQGGYDMLTQIDEEKACNEDYECKTNLCVGACVSLEKLQETQKEQISWIRKLVCKLLNPLSSTDCVNDLDSNYCKCIIS